MWFYRRIFTICIGCGLLLGCVFFVRMINSGHNKPIPDFLPNVSRFRPSRVCSSRAVVLVNSSPGHRHRRQVIRETWAHPRITQELDFSVAFGVGRASSTDSQRSVDLEAEIFGDVFQEPGVDTDGTSSSSKVIQLLKSARGACAPLPEFILKIEDGVFVNPFSLDELLQTVETFSSSNALWCLEWQRIFDKPHSNLTWIVPQAEFNGQRTVRPTYCLSTVYLMTGRALDAVLRQHDGRTGSVMLPEDVYVTGMLAREARIVLFYLGERLVFDSKNYPDVSAGKVAFAFLGEEVEDSTAKFWSSLSNQKLNLTGQYDIEL